MNTAAAKNEMIRILAVDDDESLLRFYAKVLSKPPRVGREPQEALFAITLSSNVRDALEKVRSGLEKGHPFAVIFLDVRIPRGIDGLRAAEKIRAMDQATHIVLVTAFDDVDLERVVKHVPPADKLLYLRKPFAAAELRQLALALGEKYQTEQTLRTHEVQRSGRVEAQEHAATDELLAQKEAFNFALFQHNPLPITVVDREGLVIRSNLARRKCELPLPAIGHPLFEGWEEQCRIDLQQELIECIKRGTVKEYQDVPLNDRHFTITIAPLPSGALVILNDITRLKQAEEQARLRQEQLIQAQKMAALGSLVSGMAHEVSNPNNVLLLNAGTLSKLCGALVSRLKQWRHEHGEFEIGGMSSAELCAELPQLVEGMTRAAERIRATVDSLKQFSRKSDAKLREPVDLNKVVGAAVALLAPVLRKATHRLELDYTNLPPVLGIPQQLEQVLVNLLTNACQALPSPEKGIRITTRYLASSGRVEVEVADEGCGIAPDVLPHITEPFFTTRESAGGTGLGLSISEKIVTEHGGTLRFSSGPNRGTTAIVSLPVWEKGGSKGD